MPIAIVIEKSAARSPAGALVVQARFVGDIGERAIAVIVKQNIVPPEAAEQIVPSVVVEVTHAHAGLPTGAGQAGFRRDIGECSIAVVLVKMRGGRLSYGPRFAQAGSIGQIDIEPAVMVVVEKCKA